MIWGPCQADIRASSSEVHRNWSPKRFPFKIACCVANIITTRRCMRETSNVLSSVRRHLETNGLLPSVE